jgi:hypothetical protein
MSSNAVFVISENLAIRQILLRLLAEVGLANADVTSPHP